MKKQLLSLIACAALCAPIFAADDSAPPAPPSVDVAMTTDTSTGKSTDLEYKVKLKIGWNMVAIPGYKVYQVRDLIGNKEYVSSVFNYDASLGNYAGYNNSGGTNGMTTQVTTLVPGMGYWVKALKPFLLVFKTNVPSNMDNYERAAFVPPANGTTVTDFKESEMGAPIPVVTVGYDDMWDANTSKLKTAVQNSAGTTDWTAIKATDYSKTDWTSKQFMFDFNMLMDKRFVDQEGRSYQFRPSPSDPKTGTIEIKAASTAARERALRATGSEIVGGRFFIDQKGRLVVQMPGATDLVFEMVDIKEDKAVGKLELRIKNADSGSPYNWTLTNVYNPTTKAWMDASTLVKQVDQAAKDTSVKYVDWNNLKGNKDTAMAGIDAGFTPRDYCGNPLKQRTDGTYPFPGDADFPSKDSCPKVDANSTAANAPVPIDCQGNPLPKKADGTYPYPGEKEFPAACQPKNGGMVVQPAGKAPLDCQGKELPKKADGTYPYPGDKEFPSYCAQGAAGVPVGVNGIAVGEPNPNSQVPKDCKGRPLVKVANGTYAGPADPEFPADCKAFVTQQQQQAPTAAPLDCKGNPLPKKTDGTYPKPGDAEFPAACNFTAPIKQLPPLNSGTAGSTAGQVPQGTQPTGTKPTGTQPAGTQPTGTQPAGTQPAGTQPTGTQPTGTQPAGTQPAGTQLH